MERDRRELGVEGGESWGELVRALEIGKAK
jgi:hypothetical protein